MKFKTIWTLRAMTFTERLSRTRDWFAQKVGRALPVRIRYWVAMQMVGDATMDSPNVLATQLADIIKKFEAPKNLS